MKTVTAFRTQEGKNEIFRAYDEFLQGWGFPYEEISIDTRYGKTYLLAGGDKNNPPLLLLHGTGMNSIMWLKDIKEYALKYRVYAVDIVGEPGKSDDRQLPLKGSFYADWLYDVFDKLSIGKAIIIGISLGAWLGAKFAINYPEKTDKLVLLSPSGIGPQRKAFIFTAVYYGIFGEKGTERLYAKINGNKPLPDSILQYQKLIRNNFHYRHETIPLFSDKELAKLSMPTVLLAGRKDIMLHSEKTAARLETLLPQATICLLPEEGHSIVNPAKKIKKFL